jgi:hypothetical protein
MRTLNSVRLSELLRRHQRASRTSETIKAWSVAGVTGSAFSHEQQEELLEGMRSKAVRLEDRDGSLDAILTEFGSSSDMVAVVGWNVETDPGVLIPGKTLCRSEGFLREAYPNGFIVCDQPLTRLLIVDFDEVDFEVEEMWFDTSEK